MVELDQYKFKLNDLVKPLADIGVSLDIDNKKNRIAELDKAMEEPDFWNDPDRSSKMVKEELVK